MKKTTFLILSLFLCFSLKMSAQISDGIYYIYPEKSNNHRLDNIDNRALNGNGVHLWESNNTNAQKWKVRNTNRGIQIISMNNENMVLDNSDGRCVDRNRIQIWDNFQNKNQFWVPEKVGTNLFVLHCYRNQHYVLDWGGELKNGGVVHLFQYYPGLTNQIWRFVRIR